MTVNNPPSYLQNDGPNAEQHRSHMTATFGGQPGVLESTHLEVTEKSGTPDMSVDVAGGKVLVAGTEGTYQGLYLCHNRGTTNLAISASDPTNDRYDLIVATVEDADYSGATDAWKLDVVSGTPAATPLFPSIDDNTFVLATVLVQNGVSSILNADITDLRTGTDTDGTTTLTNYGTAPTPGKIVCNSARRPQSPFTGMEIYETDTDNTYIYDGSDWALTAGYEESTLTLGTNIGTLGAPYGSTVRCRLGPDGKVTIVGTITNTSGGNIIGTYTLATVPSGYRPDIQVITHCNVNAVGTGVRVDVDTSGVVSLVTGYTFTTGAFMPFEMEWFVA